MIAMALGACAMLAGCKNPVDTRREPTDAAQARGRAAIPPLSRTGLDEELHGALCGVSTEPRVARVATRPQFGVNAGRLGRQDHSPAPAAPHSLRPLAARIARVPPRPRRRRIAPARWGRRPRREGWERRGVQAPAATANSIYASQLEERRGERVAP